MNGFELTTDWLRLNHTMIHFFGLGFIQVKLGEFNRVHFYSPALPAVVEDPHNHRYDFASTVLSGRLKNTIYEVGTTGRVFLMEQDSCQAGFVSPVLPQEVCLLEVFSKVYEKGESYYMDHHTLHTVAGENAITFLSRGPYRKALANITRKYGAEKTCPFSQKIPESELWEIVDGMIKQAKMNEHYAEIYGNY